MACVNQDSEDGLSMEKKKRKNHSQTCRLPQVSKHSAWHGTAHLSTATLAWKAPSFGRRTTPDDRRLVPA